MKSLSSLDLKSAQQQQIKSVTSNMNKRTTKIKKIKRILSLRGGGKVNNDNYPTYESKEICATDACINLEGNP
jgi:ABC-type phosphate/phosphonate transport system substrate-binding protein